MDAGRGPALARRLAAALTRCAVASRAGASRVRSPAGRRQPAARREIGARKPRASWPRSPSTPAGRSPPTCSPTWSGAAIRRGRPTARCTPTSPACAALTADRRGRSLGTTDHGYLLRVDAPTSTPTVRRRGPGGRARPGAAGRASCARRAGGWPDRAEVAPLEQLEAALAAWTGEPYADLPDHPDVLAERAALEQLRAVGRGGPAARRCSRSAKTPACCRRPSRRSRPAPAPRTALGAPRARAARAGRQVEALARCARSATLLADELGLDPRPELRRWSRRSCARTPRCGTVPAEPPGRAPPPATAPSRRPSRRRRRGGAEQRRPLAELLDRAARGGPPWRRRRGARDRQGLARRTLAPPPNAGTWSARALLPGRRRAAAVAVAAVLRALDAARALADLVRRSRRPPARWRSRPGSGSPGAAAAAADGAGPASCSTTCTGPTRRRCGRCATCVDGAADDCALVVAHPAAHPEPTGPLALVAEAFARRQALRLELTGLDAADAAELARSVGPRTPTTVEAWHRRSGGNPFFLVELARLGRHGGRGARHRARSRRPPAGGLPGETLETLGAAAVVGRLPGRGGRGRRGDATPRTSRRPRDRAARPGWSRTTAPRSSPSSTP